MESSSEESFAWSKASTGSDDSEETHLILNNYECDEVIKKDEPDSNSLSKKELKIKKRKHKQKSLDIDEEIDGPKKKKIKSEPESDSELGKKKKKQKEISNEHFNNLYYHEDNYLTMKVKQERESGQSLKCLKSKKHSNLSESIDNFEVSSEVNDNSQAERKKKKKRKHNKDVSENEETLSLNGPPNHCENDGIENCRKSPNKKKHKENGFCAQEDLNNFVIKELEENTAVESKYTKRKKNKLEKHNGYNSEDGMETSKSEIDTSSANFVDKEFNQNHDVDNNTKFLEHSFSNEDASNKTLKHSPQRKSRLSDRIQFEDEIDSDSQLDTNKTDENSSHTKRYLSENINLQQVSTKNNEITVDDELWILKCPQDVDINKLNNCDFNLDNKSKIKINGETYYGTLNDSEKINILSSYKHEFKIQNLVPNGIIYFKKRLPKPHYNEDNVMVNNQTFFIPLPDTKCRHPLFGSNYKDFINVPIKSLSPLNDMSLSSDKKKKKKHKKGQYTEIEVKPKIEYDSETSEKKLPEEELDLNVAVKKAKKRKHTNDQQNEKKSKKVKLEPDSTEAWESEKAIEENLFNF